MIQTTSHDHFASKDIDPNCTMCALAQSFRPLVEEETTPGPFADLEIKWADYTKKLDQAASYSKHADERAEWATEDDEIVKHYRAMVLVKVEGINYVAAMERLGQVVR